MIVYEYYNQNVLCINQDAILELPKVGYDQFQKWCQRKKLNRLRTKGNGRSGLIEWATIQEEWLRKQLIKAFGDPYRKDDVKSFIARLKNDDAAAIFLAKASLSKEKEYKAYVEAQILNLYGELLQDIHLKKARNSGFKTVEAKEELTKIIADLKTVRFEDSKKKRFPHTLPTNWRGLQRRYERYIDESYDNLIHGGTGNVNTKKIKGKIADWLLASYCLPHKPNTIELHKDYMQKRAEMKWPSITEGAIYAWLQQTPQRKVWVLARQGKAVWINEFGHKVVRDKSDWFPNCYLAIDGSKLDWIHYKDRKGKNYNMAADLKIDVVFDVYSEKILGYYCGTDHENYTQHFSALKMAVSESMTKPLTITYDGQGGHVMSEMEELYDRLVTSDGGEHYKHRANEHGSPAEGLFGRFQQQILNKVWWSDKQAVHVRKEDSKPNMEFIKRFRHKLKKVEECIEAVDYYVEKWNKQEHPLFAGQTRNEVYGHEATYELDKLNELDMMRLFWITSKKPKEYKNDGLRVTIRKVDYHFEVYDLDGNVDIEFRDNYTGCKFFYEYDPNQLDNYVRLYLRLPNGDTKYIADAQPVKKVRTLSAKMTEKDKAHKHKMMHVRDNELSAIEEQLEALRHRTNITEESLIEDQELELKFRGNIPKKVRATAEAGAGSYHTKY